MTETVRQSQLAIGDACQVGDKWHRVANVSTPFDHKAMCTLIVVTTTSGAELNLGPKHYHITRIPAPILQALEAGARNPYRH